MKDIKNFKIGDKLLCKKNFGPYDNFTMDNYYEITDVLIYTEVVIINKKIFSIDKNLNDFSSSRFDYLWDYFKTKQEERKIKIQSLNLI
jgi:hypothetical protein